MNAQPTVMLDPRWTSEWEDTHLAAKPKITPPLQSRIPMWLFVASNGVRVLSCRPVEVEVGKEGPDEESPESCFVFKCAKLHVFASGSTYKVAEDAFHEQVVHFFFVYRNIPDNDLAKDAAEIKALYKQYFKVTS